ncbi:MAG: hypothetical protein KKD79_06870 [Candidatus Omnitrophica bacterium]|nr:hypothetical protein [Candidatus Omnitrophota bacterium]
MDDPTLKKSQVSLEFILGFIAILLLFVGSFNIWLEVNDKFITENKDYQSQRLVSGQGNFSGSQPPGVDVESPQVDDETMQKIINIMLCGCCCISDCGTQQEVTFCIDDGTKQRAKDLYIEQYQLKIKVDTYTDVDKATIDALASLRAAYDLIPWCSQCCQCNISCGHGACNKLCDDGDGGDYCCGWDPPDPDWRYCEGSLSNQCVSCPVAGGWPFYWGWACPGDDSDSGPTGTCIDIRKTSDHNHHTWRQQITDGIDETTIQYNENKLLLDQAIADKIVVDAEVEAIKTELVCCGV